MNLYICDLIITRAKYHRFFDENKEENLKDMNKTNIKAIQEYYKNDIRSMINFLQVDKNRKTNIIIEIIIVTMKLLIC